MKTATTERGGLYKLSLRYYRDDIEYMRENFPHNYTAEVRSLLAQFVERHKRRNK